MKLDDFGNRLNHDDIAAQNIYQLGAKFNYFDTFIGEFNDVCRQPTRAAVKSLIWCPVELSTLEFLKPPNESDLCACEWHRWGLVGI